ncbi:DnaT-like ssDNA-binding domain-containing protein [Alteromonas sp. ASW11-36]|uniref:DnaT-like ssDNA-binding domain-containing protein n=1 Tax=Alteromonas arenosi TaxID=3055817 RepID=A0ABT7SUV2_9ALTE|nr:DnaT-like ssDNA-binding domain-containing protein [Alteromonas sp. ASW11-36]MDM7859337.1 DnaT-like ssDNA-binding domain-containing protein [Alteromonas sp. ASW11-36]
MNSAELDALSQPLSNPARVLYMLSLRPNANVQTGASGELVYKHIMQLLNGTEQHFTLGRQINALLKELVNVGLIEIPSDCDINRSLNNKRVILPLVVVKQASVERLHQNKSAIYIDWQPDDKLFAELAQLVGLIDKAFTPEETGDFVAYWLGRPDTQLSHFQWTQKFVSYLKQQRLAKVPRHKTQIGSQLTTPQSAVEIDDNARKLVEKYRSKQ